MSSYIYIYLSLPFSFYRSVAATNAPLLEVYARKTFTSFLLRASSPARRHFDARTHVIRSYIYALFYSPRRTASRDQVRAIILYRKCLYIIIRNILRDINFSHARRTGDNLTVQYLILNKQKK